MKIEIIIPTVIVSTFMITIFIEPVWRKRKKKNKKLSPKENRFWPQHPDHNIRLRRMEQAGYTIAFTKPIAYGTQVRTECGSIINMYDTGNVLFQGVQNRMIKSFWGK